MQHSTMLHKAAQVHKPFAQTATTLPARKVVRLAPARASKQPAQPCDTAQLKTRSISVGIAATVLGALAGVTSLYINAEVAKQVKQEANATQRADELKAEFKQEINEVKQLLQQYLPLTTRLDGTVGTLEKSVVALQVCAVTDSTLQSVLIASRHNLLLSWVWRASHSVRQGVVPMCACCTQGNLTAPPVKTR